MLAVHCYDVVKVINDKMVELQNRGIVLEHDSAVVANVASLRQ